MSFVTIKDLIQLVSSGINWFTLTTTEVAARANLLMTSLAIPHCSHRAADCWIDIPGRKAVIAMPEHGTIRLRQIKLPLLKPIMENNFSGAYLSMCCLNVARLISMSNSVMQSTYYRYMSVMRQVSYKWLVHRLHGARNGGWVSWKESWAPRFNRKRIISQLWYRLLSSQQRNNDNNMIHIFRPYLDNCRYDTTTSSW